MHRMTRMTGPDCAVMCNLINTHTHTHTHTHLVCSIFFSFFSTAVEVGDLSGCVVLSLSISLGRRYKFLCWVAQASKAPRNFAGPNTKTTTQKLSEILCA